MVIKDKVAALVAWGSIIRQDELLEEVIHKTEVHNRWFTRANTRQSLEAICEHFLNEEALNNWIGDLPGSEPLKKVGLVLAGNVPLVGFHDILSVLAAGNIAQVKLSSKERYLLPYLIKLLESASPELAGRVEFVDQLAGFDAIIATGSNNSSRYFRHYFEKYPHIIRKNRTSAAVLTGEETTEELQELAKDVFSYFGLGCRNVSKLFLPEGFDPTKLLEQWEGWNEITQHDKYKNNYDYNRTLLIMNKTPHLASEFLMLVEKEEPLSPVATLHYEFYPNKEVLAQRLSTLEAQLQCVVGRDYLDFGSAQQPGLSDYADGVDTLAFLNSLT